MTRLPRLYVVMLRYRIAAMVVLFMLLGAANEGPLRIGWRELLAALALASSYVSATALNDLADEQIDKVNHPLDAGRPLVEGTGTRRDLWVLHVVAAVLALALIVPLGRPGLLLIAASLLVSHAYSARPLRISYRVAGAPVLLGVAYVVVPVSLGIVAAGGDLRHFASRFTVALFLLFCARIVLKDFRDREGDALYGKPTLLLRYGKRTTCAVSALALASADIVLTTALPLGAALLAQILVAAIAWMLWRLARTDDRCEEQVAIGTGARAGNGLLLTALAWLTLTGEGAPLSDVLAFTGALVAVFAGTIVFLAANSDQAVIGYKG